MKKTLTEEIGYFRNLIDDIATGNDLLTLLESAMLLEYSSMIDIVGDKTGGKNLIRYMHKKYGLRHDAEYLDMLDPANGFTRTTGKDIAWKSFKYSPDNFMILVGAQGVAAVKPDEARITKRKADAEAKGIEYDPAGDSKMPYRIVAFKGDERIPDAVFTGDDPDLDPGTVRTRGGLPSKKDFGNPENLFDRVQEQIGRISGILVAKEAVPREVMTKRQEPRQYGTTVKSPGGGERFRFAEYTPAEAEKKVRDRLSGMMDKLGTDENQLDAVLKSLEPMDLISAARGETPALRKILDRLKFGNTFSDE
jgi:hypothetical protein